LTAMAYTGARTSEVVTLEWGDIRWRDGIIFIPAERTKTRRTGKPRRLPLLPRIVRLLRFIERWKHRHPVYVFCCAWHRSIDERERELWRWIREDLKPYLQDRLDEFNADLKPGRHAIKLPEDWTPYWMRHTFATEAVDQVGLDLAASTVGNTPELLGRVYDHVSSKRVKKVAAAVDKARRNRKERTRD